VTEEHPRRRRALGWGEKPLKLDNVDPNGWQARPTKSRSAKPNWVEFPHDLTSEAEKYKRERFINELETRLYGRKPDSPK
jgi:hypothetical protein